jgi:hypothetical protein
MRMSKWWAAKDSNFRAIVATIAVFMTLLVIVGGIVTWSLSRDKLTHSPMSTTSGTSGNLDLKSSVPATKYTEYETGVAYGDKIKYTLTSIENSFVDPVQQQSCTDGRNCPKFPFRVLTFEYFNTTDKTIDFSKPSNAEECNQTSLKEYEECLESQRLGEIMSYMADDQFSFKCIDRGYKSMRELGFKTTHPEDTIDALRKGVTAPVVFYPNEKKTVVVQVSEECDDFGNRTTHAESYWRLN